ncbi:MAG: MMPL family transporter, partial [Methylobacteriaceae bacterium]|nr:MMPL family transporter [Methylobacteriaceae bacterium]
MNAPPAQRSRSLALGIERLGLISLRFPAAAAIVLVVLAVLGGFGVARLKVDDSLSQLFRSNTPEYRQFEETVRRFPSAEYDVLVVVEAKDLLARENIEKLRDAVTDLQLIEGTRGLISLFSARQPPEGNELPAPVFPDQLPQGEAYDKLVAKVRANEIIRGKLLSEDGELALIVLSLKPEIVATDGLRKVVGEVRDTMEQDLSGSDLKSELSGVPVMQLEIRNAVERDRILYNAIGFFAGCGIAILFFRRVSFMIIAAAPPLIAILLALGTFGWFDFRLNMFLNVMTPLIMVISFADSMQLTFAARDRLIAGEDKYTAFRNVLFIVGPACVLTHATAGLSFIALLFSQSDLIRAFGEAGLLATIIALLTVLIVLPLLGVLLLRDTSGFAGKVRGADTGVDLLRRFCAW